MSEHEKQTIAVELGREGEWFRRVEVVVAVNDAGLLAADASVPRGAPCVIIRTVTGTEDRSSGQQLPAVLPEAALELANALISASQEAVRLRR